MHGIRVSCVVSGPRKALQGSRKLQETPQHVLDAQDLSRPDWGPVREMAGRRRPPEGCWHHDDEDWFDGAPWRRKRKREREADKRGGFRMSGAEIIVL